MGALLEPAVTDALAEILDEACQLCSDQLGICDHITRDAMAHRLMMLAELGERDRQQLLRYGLAGVPGMEKVMGAAPNDRSP